MALSDARVVFAGKTPHSHEQEAIRFAIQQLPDTEPYHLWALCELLDPSRGNLYEIDLLVLGPSALYLIEVKSGPGEYEGDAVDWWRTPPGEPRRYMPAPYPLANLKAKVLKGLLQRKMRDPKACPRVEALIFLSHEQADVRKLLPEGRFAVLTRGDLLRAVTQHDIPGAPPRTPRRIGPRTVSDVVQGLRALGIRPREGLSHVGPYRLETILAEGEGYQDRLAQHRESPRMRRRARTYLVPDQTSVERRQQLRRAADREAQLLYDVREHPGILQITDYVTDAPLGPTVLFDEFDGGVPLDAFLRTDPDVTLADRVAIIEQVGRALSHCHRREVYHGAVSPQSVLVRRRDDRIEARLFNFQLGAGSHVDATRHWSALAADPWAIYQAPELREDPTARSRASDLFSLGALTYFVLTGHPPGDDPLDVHRRLVAARCLDPLAVADNLHADLVEHVRTATDITPACRFDDADVFVEILVQHATRPDASTDEADPLQATKGDHLGSFQVEGVLGVGATSRVLLVIRTSDQRELALKVAASPDHDERLAREAEAIRKLHHSRIVQVVDEPVLSGRHCLLLTLAGSATLQQHLAKEGVVSLDLASRYGEELLLALEHLEDEGVMHRDIKPANIGVGQAGKKGYHLTLFDFSLAIAPPGDITVGTAVYRDPFLPERGVWDFAAERWSAAVTLHEMLTGVRPSYEPIDGPASAGLRAPAADARTRLRLAAERFDPAARDRLVAFFEQALARASADRFPSAHAMRHAWNGCFESAIAPLSRPSSGASSTVTPSPDDDTAPAAKRDLSPRALAAIEPDTPLGALPLSDRARNALDRSGILQASDLLALPDNRISSIRGIGTLVAAEILRFRNGWMQAKKLEPQRGAPFFEGYRGASLPLDGAPALADAGIFTLDALAAAPAVQVETLARRHGFDASALRHKLDAEHRRALGSGTARGLAELLDDLLLPARKKRSQLLRLLFGLDAPFTGRLDVRNAEVASHTADPPGKVSAALTASRGEWARHEAAIEPYGDTVHAIVDDHGGAVPLSALAAALIDALPGERPAPGPLDLARAAAVARIACELERDTPDGLHLVRLHDDAFWVLADASLAARIRRLGAAADELASRDVIASPGEVQRVLGSLVKHGPFERIGADRLTALAAAASTRAARSPRLELYPRGMSADRALELSSAVLEGKRLTPADVAQRVAARYPEAEPLPDRPALDALLEPFGLRWSEAHGGYLRPGARPDLATSFSTRMSTTFSSGMRSNRPGPSPDVVARSDFDERVKSTLERRGLRVVGVTANHAERAALALQRRFDLDLVLFDQRLCTAIDAAMKRARIPSDDVIHAADREGPAGRSWRNLLRLVNQAAGDLATELLPPRRPLLLAQPGPIARYELTDFLAHLVAASKHDDAEAIFLLVPAHDTGGIPAINGELAIPGILPSQAMWLPPAWLYASDPAA